MSTSPTVQSHGTAVPDRSDVASLIEDRKWEALKALSASAAPALLVDLMRQFDSEERVLLYRSFDRGKQAAIFRELTPKEQNQLFREITSDDTKRLLESLSPDDRTTLLEELPAEVTEKVLNLLEDEDLKTARELLGYPEESIGRLMTPNFVAVRPGWTVDRVLRYIRTVGEEPETIASIYVTGTDGTLLDHLRLRRIVQADPEDTIKDLMDYVFVSLAADRDQETAVRTMDQYALSNLPVVDSQGRLLGIVTADDMFDVAEVEATEDFQRLGGSEPLERPYFDLSILEISWKRVGWLLLLFLGGTLTSSVIGAFEDQLSGLIILSFFIPLLIGTGGNAGAQSVTTIIRALALGEVRWGDMFRVILREFLVGLLVGGALGAIGFVFVVYGWNASPEVALVVALTLPVICTWANVVAGVVPIVADRVGIDPTVISAPLITTVVDATGLIIYFQLAVWLLGL